MKSRYLPKFFFWTTMMTLVTCSSADETFRRSSNGVSPEPVNPAQSPTSPDESTSKDDSGPTKTPNNTIDFDFEIMNSEACSKQLNYIQIPQQTVTGNDGGSAYYRDVMGHYDPTQGKHHATTLSPAENIVFTVHETLHFTALGQYQKYRSADPTFGHHFLYMGSGKGVQLARSSTEKRDMIPLIGSNIQKVLSTDNSRNSSIGTPDITYSTYIQKQSASSDPGLRAAVHILEETIAYISDYRVGVEMAEAGTFQTIPKGKNLTMIYLGMIAAQAISQKDSAYFTNNDTANKFQLKPLLACLSERAMGLHTRAKKQNGINTKVEDFILNELRNGASSEGLRGFIQSWQGSEWASRVLGF